MSFLSLVLHCLESGPVHNRLDLLCRWGESKEFSYLLYTRSQILKTMQWKGSHIICFLWQRSYPLGMSIATIYKQYLPSQYVFYIILELSFHIARLNLFLNRYLMLLFQEPVLIAFNFSNFSGNRLRSVLPVGTVPALPLSGLHMLWSWYSHPQCVCSRWLHGQNKIPNQLWRSEKSISVTFFYHWVLISL